MKNIFIYCLKNLEQHLLNLEPQITISQSKMGYCVASQNMKELVMSAIYIGVKQPMNIIVFLSEMSYKNYYRTNFYELRTSIRINDMFLSNYVFLYLKYMKKSVLHNLCHNPRVPCILSIFVHIVHSTSSCRTVALRS